MLNKQFLEKTIQDNFPDLNRMEFSMNNHDLVRFTERSLLPFLIYQNTTDSQCRLISLFLEDNSPSIHLLPFYIALGFYRKTLDKALSAQNFASAKYPIDKYKIVYNGNIHSVVGLNFVSRIMIIKSGTGHEIEIPFADEYKISWRYPASNVLKMKIADFDKIAGASDNNLFSVPVSRKDDHHEGMVIFTNVTKFETLLRNLKVSGRDLASHLNIQKACFDVNSGTITFKLVSSTKTRDMRTTVLISRLDTVLAYDNILVAGGGSFDHLKTIIIDDFDLQIKSSERDNSLQEYLRSLDEYYFSNLNKHLKDVYLISRTKNFDIAATIKKNNINPMSWFQRPQEVWTLNEETVRGQILIKDIDTFASGKPVTSLEEIIISWKYLAHEYFCAGQILLIINDLYILREKLVSFYSSNHIKSFVTALVDRIKSISKDWFNSGQDAGLVDRSMIFLNEVDFLKINPSVKVANEINAISGQQIVTIITNNQDRVDQQYMTDLLNTNRFNIRYFNGKEFLNGSLTFERSNETIVYLIWNKDIIDNMLTSYNLSAQIFLVGKRGINFIKSYGERAWSKLSVLSNLDEKYKLLNLTPSASFNEVVSFPAYINYHSDHQESDHVVDVVPMEEVEVTVKNIIENDRLRVKPGDGSIKTSEIATVNVFFEDGGNLIFPESRSVFYYDELHQNDDLDQQKDAKDLKSGDLVIVPKNKMEIKKLLDKLLSENPKFENLILHDNEWRSKITNYMNNNCIDFQEFRRRLQKYGKVIGADMTIKKWIDGETLAPHNFQVVMDSLAALNIIEIAQIKNYHSSVRELKSLKSTFLRTAMRKLIYNLKGINYMPEESLVTETMLSKFLDLVELKTVLFIISD
jgi:hypothetical protein